MFRVKKKKRQPHFRSVCVDHICLLRRRRRRRRLRRRRRRSTHWSRQTVPNQRDIPGEPGERNPAFVADFGHYSSCASKKQNCGKKKEKIRGLWTQIYITKEEKRKGVISPHLRGEDGFTHLALWMFTGFSLAFSGQSRGRRWVWHFRSNQSHRSVKEKLTRFFLRED